MPAITFHIPAEFEVYLSSIQEEAVQALEANVANETFVDIVQTILTFKAGEDVTVDRSIAQEFATAITAALVRMRMTFAISGMNLPERLVKDVLTVTHNVAVAAWSSFTREEKLALVRGGLAKGFTKEQILDALVQNYGAVEAEVLGLLAAATGS